ncbi:cytidylate kinase family protein [Candidatus Nomurabacteria bacterium]|nr:cytidylate kinase family protein [Candidatus Nomurabacteria bacterium]
MRKEIITITGTLGSGKSSTADKVANELGFRHFSSGDFMRQLAVDMGISLNELGEKAQTDDSIDLKIDDEVRRAGAEEKIVIDSRLAFHWIPESFKVYLDLSPEVARERILNNLNENALRKKSENSSSPEEIQAKIDARLQSEKKRYKDLYGIENHTDKKNFDLVIDTNKNNLEQVVDLVVSEYKKWLSR